ncbi:truncated integrase [Staphylococcus aureus subsp. aureus 091751]|nr:integrase [Staphylococcus aureus]EOR35413.1 truncated integrase [Staphylococcus aureus subsp. aureus 091751]
MLLILFESIGPPAAFVNMYPILINLSLQA